MKDFVYQIEYISNSFSELLTNRNSQIRKLSVVVAGLIFILQTYIEYRDILQTYTEYRSSLSTVVGTAIFRLRLPSGSSHCWWERKK